MKRQTTPRVTVQYPTTVQKRTYGNSAIQLVIAGFGTTDVVTMLLA